MHKSLSLGFTHLTTCLIFTTIYFEFHVTILSILLLLAFTAAKSSKILNWVIKGFRFKNARAFIILICVFDSLLFLEQFIAFLKLMQLVDWIPSLVLLPLWPVVYLIFGFVMLSVSNVLFGICFCIFSLSTKKCKKIIFFPFFPNF